MILLTNYNQPKHRQLCITIQIFNKLKKMKQ